MLRLSYKYFMFYLFSSLVFISSGCNENKSEIPTSLTVTEFFPTEGDFGTEVTILGSGFGDYRLDVSGKVYFNGTEATDFIKYSDNRIVVRAPDGFTSGPISVKVFDDEVATSESFNYIDVEEVDENALTITDFYPKSGYYLTEVTISGNNFGTSVNTVKVKFGGIDAYKIVSVTETEIKAIVPDNAVTGSIYVNTGTDEAFSTNEFQFKTGGASVTSINPTHAWAGQEITITGTNFHNVGAKNIVVDFKGAKAIASSATDTEIKVIVPEDAQNGTFTVSFGEEQTISGVVFQKYDLYESDFTGSYGSSYDPFYFSTGWDPCYIRIENNYLEFYFNQEACTNDDRRERRGAEVACDFSTWSEGWYGYKIYLPSGLYPDNVNNSIITQIFNTGDSNTWTGHLTISQKELYISYRGTAAAEDETKEKVGDLTYDTWIPLVLYFKAGRNNKAEIKVWLGDDMQENSPTKILTDINLGFGYWLDDNTLNGEVTEDNPVADCLGGKWGLYVRYDGDRTIRFDNLSVLSGNPTIGSDGNETTGFKIVDPR